MPRRLTARSWSWLFVCAVTGAAGCGPRAQEKEGEAQPARAQFRDGFSNETLNEAVWKITRQNDFQESTIDVLEGRLRFRAATIGTDDKTVKFHGVRTVEPVVDFSEGPVEVSFELDWNNQANGCYLTAGVYLCPVANDENPRDEENWLKIEYIGVPPGKNGRCLIATKVDKRLRHLFTEGWPKEQRTGRRIGLQKVRLQIDSDSFKVFENGKLLYKHEGHGLTFTKAHLYLQMSSHSNYPPRQVFFDNVSVGRASTIPKTGGTG